MSVAQIKGPLVVAAEARVDLSDELIIATMNRLFRASIDLYLLEDCLYRDGLKRVHTWVGANFLEDYFECVNGFEPTEEDAKEILSISSTDVQRVLVNKPDSYYQSMALSLLKPAFGNEMAHAEAAHIAPVIANFLKRAGFEVVSVDASEYGWRIVLNAVSWREHEPVFIVYPLVQRAITAIRQFFVTDKTPFGATRDKWDSVLKRRLEKPGSVKKEDVCAEMQRLVDGLIKSWVVKPTPEQLEEINLRLTQFAKYSSYDISVSVDEQGRLGFV
jgi:hypothetical protein